MMKKFSIILLWLASTVLISLYSYENPEIIEKAKNYFNGDKNLLILRQEGEISRRPGNSFFIEFSEVVSFSEKTAFIIHDKEIIVPTYKGQQGNPVLFNKLMKEKIMGITGDVGAKKILELNKDKILNLEINDQSIVKGFNTQDDFSSL